MVKRKQVYRGCQKRGLHFETECEDYRGFEVNDLEDDAPKPKKLRSGLLNTRGRDTPATQRKAMERNSASSPLLRLPSEIRNKIYEYALGGNHLEVDYEPHEHKYKTIKKQRYRTHYGGGLYHECAGEGDDIPSSLHLGLLRVCRQIYGEAALLPYALNTFVFESDWVMKRCFETLRPVQKRAMGKVSIPRMVMST
ncbi:MAG: hypothetical protein Q9225_001522 [Loekoesia sp. 1 TL-2023]